MESNQIHNKCSHPWRDHQLKKCCETCENAQSECCSDCNEISGLEEYSPIYFDKVALVRLGRADWLICPGGTNDH